MNTFSIIIPVLNRKDEIKELLESLTKQTQKIFEIIIVEDGSIDKCETVCEEYKSKLDVQYFFKENTGPGDTRNFGVEKAKNNWIIFFDSDCIIPEYYFERLNKYLNKKEVDAFGGPDEAHFSFSPIQKAINLSLTSFLTTAGVRGNKVNLDNYQPRSFNMGIKKEVFQKLGGFIDIHPGEDPDLSYKIIKNNYKIAYFNECFVYHKRRIDFTKFFNQVYKFGIVRNILFKYHSNSMKLVYFIPSLYFITIILLIIPVLNFSLIIPLIFFNLLIIIEAFFKSFNFYISFLTLISANVQLIGYGIGFLNSFIRLSVFKQDEKEKFDFIFYNKKK